MPLADWEQARVLLLDIEGTTTPVDFVYQTLFPYATRNVETFLRKHFAEPEIGALVQELRAQNERDVAAKLQPPPWKTDPEESLLRSCVIYTQWLINKDSKCTPLKSLQGRIWQQGFANGELHGDVYPDVPRAFQRWRTQQREICLYSSGSVLAQQQLFRTILSGDLTPCVSAFFDTTIGAKTAAESYEKIAKALSRPAGEILFISDAGKELEAAQVAGMLSILCERGTQTAAPRKHASIATFDEVLPD